MSHKNAPPETDVQRAVREFYSERMAQRGQTIAWGRDKQGRFLAEFARDAEAAWQAALRACADREERAQAGITDAVIETACRALCVHHHWDPDEPVTYSGTRKKARDPDGHVVLQWEMHVPEARIFLQSAALALQGDREKLRALIQEARDAEFFEDGLSADLHCADITTLPDAYIEGRLNVLDDLSCAIGDEK